MTESPLYSPQDLARLVLGYLEEEECTSAYEEFIKNSPHLDEFRTNYSKAVLSNYSSKSLKGVFSEYCASMAYIRSCKTPGLRKLLLQCMTLLDTAKLLIANVDLNKIQDNESGNQRLSSNFNSSGGTQSRQQCDQCKTININGCECQTSLPIPPNSFSKSYNITTNENETNTHMALQDLVETTEPAVQPGTSDADKRKNNSCSSQPIQQDSLADSRLRSDTTSAASLCYEQTDSLAKKTPVLAGSLSLSVKTNDLIDCSEDINEILSIVNHSNITGNDSRNVSVVNKIIVQKDRRLSTADRTFQDFVSGVSTGDGRRAVPEAMPDSSTPESNMSQNQSSVMKPESYTSIPIQILPNTTGTLNQNARLSTCYAIMKSSEVQKHNKYADETGNRESLVGSEFEMSANLNTSNQKHVIGSSAKSICSKVKILSNDLLKTANEDGTIIFNNGGTTTTLRPLPCKPHGVQSFSPLPTANSIIHINGLPSYQNTKKKISNVYTKEEIMAMPTVIVLQPPTTTQSSTCGSSSDYVTTVPVTTSCLVPTSTNICYTKPSTSQNMAQVDSGYRSLEPISMEVEPTEPLTIDVSSKHFIPSGQEPKESVSMGKVTTPNKPLLAKKASSTPRRSSSSHVRVLDFTTPHRILSTHNEPEEDNALSLTPDILTTGKTQATPKNSTFTVISKQSITKIDKLEKKSKADWDADLRALLSSNSPEKKVKVRIRKKSLKVATENNDIDSKCKDDKLTKKKKLTKIKKVKENEVNEIEPPATIKSVVKPTINLIKDWRDEPKPCVAKVQVDENVDTPQTDLRPKTDIPSSSKHNLSDLFLLQTPYKMMMDHIQMDTPRFIDASLLDGPMSDIKIDSIPTPNFLNTPNFLLSGGKSVGVVGATPSSYSSRPTDYSSGGSYYRPDEHDYGPLPDLKPTSQLITTYPSNPSTSSKTDIAKSPKKKIKKENRTIANSSRPRRQCTLKVSYFETSASKSSKETKLNKSHNRENRSPSASSDDSSDLRSCNSKLSQLLEKDVQKDPLKYKNVIENKEEILGELEKKRKRMIANLKKKTPIKNPRKRNSFPKVKIEKKNLGNKSKTVADINHSMGPRKIPISKEKGIIKTKNKSYSPSSSVAPLPTKSRRKSSTPRKVDKNTVHSLDDSVSTEMISNKHMDATEDELPPLRVSSDDGSQDTRYKKTQIIDDGEDIVQIKAYIETSKDMEPTVQELVQRGFDLETARSIERDLLGTISRQSYDENYEDSEEKGKIIVDIKEQVQSSKIIVTIEPQPYMKDDSNVTSKLENKNKSHNESEPVPSKGTSKNIDNIDCSSSLNDSVKNDSAIILEGDIVMVRQTFCEESDNHFNFCYEETEVGITSASERIAPDFCLNVQCDDSYIRVCLQKAEILFDLPPVEKTDENGIVPPVLNCTQSSSSSSDSEVNSSIAETQNAVQSISNIRPLYTPRKSDLLSSPRKSDTHTLLQRQCIDIFDSTLNSLDTPIKSNFSKSTEAQTNISQEEDEQAQESWNLNTKRKKLSSSPVEESSSKKSKQDHQILMQNIDIESLLTKLHGENN